MANRSLRLEVILAAIDKASAPFKRVMGGSTALGKSIRATNQQLKKLNADQARVTTFRKLKNDTEQSSIALRAAQQRVAELRREMSTAGGATKKMTSALNAAAKQEERLKAAHVAKLRALRDSRTALTAAGVGTRELGNYERRLRAEIEGASRAMRTQQSRLGALQAAQQRAARMRSAGVKATATGAGMAYAGQRVLRGAVAPAAAAISFESAMADVRKVVNFDTPQQFAQMGRDVQDLSMRLPMIPDDIAKIIAAAGQAGVARSELLVFASDAVKMGVAFDQSAEDAGQTMATWRTAFRMPQRDVVMLADKINYLGNTGPASVNKITDVVNRIGALGEVAGLQSGPLAAVGATVAGMGIESEVSATGIKNLLLTLSSGEAATKRQRGAMKALGIDAVKTAKDMQDDAGPAIIGVLKTLRELPKHQQAAVMTQLFGRESIGAIAPLLTNLELLEKNLNKVSDAKQYGASMEKEYQSRVATSANALQLAKNTALVLAQAIGSTLIPDIKVLAAQVGAVVGRVVGWIREHPKLTRAVALTTIAGAALVTVLGGLLFTGGLAAMALSQIQGAVSLLSGGRGIGMLVSGLRALPGVLAAISVPAWPVLAVIAAIAAAGFLVWKYWQPIKAFFVGLWSGFREAMGPALQEMRTALAPLAPLWEALKQAMAPVLQWFRDLFTPFQATKEQLAGATRYGRIFGIVLGAAIGNTVRGLVGIVSVALRVGAVFARVFAWSPVQTISTAWAGALAFLTGLQARFRTIGANLISGLVAGLLGGFKQLREATERAGSNISQWLRGKLGIKSPSRVFAQIGDYTMQGLAGGLDRSGKLPLRALTAIAGNLRSAGAGLALGAAVLPAHAAIDQRGPVSPAASAAASTGGGNTYQVTIQAAAGMDTAALARMVRAELERMERERGARSRSALTDYGDD